MLTSHHIPIRCICLVYVHPVLPNSESPLVSLQASMLMCIETAATMAAMSQFHIRQSILMKTIIVRDVTSGVLRGASWNTFSLEFNGETLDV